MKKFTNYAIIVTLFHFVVVGIHGFAHQVIPVPVSILQYLFIIPVITIAPIVAIVLLQGKSFYTGITLLFCSMLGALVFGVYNHFIVISPDHISQIPVTSWGKVFQITAFLLLISEVVGVGISLWGLINKEKESTVF
ncbi:hypothetical protein [Mastigocoleus testarum]|uniref:Uncharacterized protein n=1 Tax=Mastigocoleus testarum BC008 TaxID=371196 RepID=A0A0V7ZUM0_9CYAN|nr:hypothetical protein [Mastigocoleus testarum]KST68065.1 hypothetical protein BC008_00005 [Mastigocoleus testarum BC008]